METPTLNTSYAKTQAKVARQRRRGRRTEIFPAGATLYFMFGEFDVMLLLSMAVSVSFAFKIAG